MEIDATSVEIANLSLLFILVIVGGWQARVAVKNQKNSIEAERKRKSIDYVLEKGGRYKQNLAEFEKAIKSVGQTPLNEEHLAELARDMPPRIQQMYNMILDFEALAVGVDDAIYDLETLELIEGDLPNRARRLVREWAEQYKDELQRMWDTQEFKQLPGLE